MSPADWPLCHVPLHTDLQGLQQAGGMRGQAAQLVEFGARGNTQIHSESGGAAAGRQPLAGVAQSEWDVPFGTLVDC